jgi:hypothetical protein
MPGTSSNDTNNWHGNQHPAGWSPPGGGPNSGAWTQNKNPDGSWSGSWTWDPHATPDPNLVSQYGNGALTDISRDPGGNLNHGAWRPVHGGGWTWTWGANPDPNLAKTYGNGALTNPNQSPDGGQGPGDPNNVHHPLSPDVVPPTVVDIWNGVAPDVTGKLSQLPDGSQPPVSQPPSHNAYRVSPGSIRNAENQLLARVDGQISQYDDLKAYVEQTHSQNIYNSDSGLTEGQLSTTQDHLLQNIGDTIELCGQYIGMLNNAAQNYAHADIGSFVPDMLTGAYETPQKS